MERLGARDLPWVMLALRRLMGAVGLLESVIVGRPGVGLVVLERN